MRAAAAFVGAPRAATLYAAALCAATLCAATPSVAAEPGVAVEPGVAAETGVAESAGAVVFANRCAVCHGPQAAGIPGSFPSLHEQVVAFAKIPQGRDYLVMVVTTGLMGHIKVGGIAYDGVMPAQSGLTETEVAGVLSYLARDLGKNEIARDLGKNESGTVALSAADVTDARARHADGSAQATRALRPAADP